MLKYSICYYAKNLSSEEIDMISISGERYLSISGVASCGSEVTEICPPQSVGESYPGGKDQVSESLNIYLYPILYIVFQGGLSLNIEY